MDPEQAQIASALGLMCVVAAFRTAWKDSDDSLAKSRALAGGIRSTFAVLWPAVLLRVVCSDDRTNDLWVPILCTWGLWLLDALLLFCGPPAVENTPASLRLEPSYVTGMAFGLCSIVGSRPDGKHSHLFVLAVIGCLVFVLPNHTMASDSVAAHVFESVQKGALWWCVGFLITGVVLARKVACSVVKKNVY